MNQKDFDNFLKERGVQPASPNIPPTLGIHRGNAYIGANFVSVPPRESYPISPPFQRIRIPIDSMCNMLMAAQVDVVASSLGHKTQFNIPPYLKMIGVHFSSEDEFRSFKKSMNSYYQEEAQVNDMEECFGICAESRCCNIVVRPFNFCTVHLVKDPQFHRQEYIRQCSYIDANGVQCTAIAKDKKDKCYFHSIPQ